MKIALCFAGQPRFINLMNFGNLTNGHDVTTYAHFWWDDEYRGDMFAWNSELKYPDDYDPIDHFEQKMQSLKQHSLELSSKVFHLLTIYEEEQHRQDYRQRLSL